MAFNLPHNDANILTQKWLKMLALLKKLF